LSLFALSQGDAIRDHRYHGEEAMSYSEKTVPGMFHNRAERYQYETCVRFKDQGSYLSISWNEMARRVVNLGLGLISLGVKKGDIVAIFADNRWEWLVADLAILSIGAADAPIYATNSGEEAAYIINDAGAKVCFVSGKDHLERIMNVRSKVKGLKKIITFDGIIVNDKNTLSLDAVMALGDKAKDKRIFDERMDEISPEDLATLIYTSGTTGAPKGVMLTHRNFIANVHQCYASHASHLSHQDEGLAILPWSHSFGRTVGIYLMLHIGAVISLAESFSTVLTNLQEIRPTLICSVPRLFEKMYSGINAGVEKASPLKQRLFAWARAVAERAVDYIVQNRDMPWTLHVQYDLAEKLVFSKLRTGLGLNRMRIAINGGGPLSVEIDRFFNSIGVPLHNGYGLTETTPVTNVNTFEVFEFGSVGPVVADTQVKIADDGEILIKGPQVMKGYYGRPDDTKACFTVDGWFTTGDIGHVDKRGCLHITDRKKDIIITAGGKNISPQNIENTLVADLLIEQAVVIGEGRKFLSALIVPNFAELVSYAKAQGIAYATNEDLVKKPEIVQFYDTKIKALMKDYARVEQLRAFRVLPREFSIDSGELTPTLKLKRKVINKHYAEIIESMYKDGGE
jgi:long-chain acyl-CoA synthetase